MSSSPRLPVPDLNETCRRYLQQVRPLLDDAAYQKTEAATRYFRSHKGRELQTALQEFAEEAEGSWLIDAWLASYLDIRTPLPLASNVGFILQNHGKGAAEWAAALAAVCADYHHRRIPQPQTPQGTPVCMAQWAILQGACRIPQLGSDGFRFALQSRHIGVFHNGFYYRIAALDENFEAYHPDTFRQAFEHILAEQSGNPYPVTVPVYLGGDDTARLYQELQKQDDNNRLLEHIEQDLFHISLYHQEQSADDDLARASFQPLQDVWCYKPTTYCYNTATNRLFLHCEHSWEDGGALKGIITLAAEKLTQTSSGQRMHAAITRYEWLLNNDQQQNWPKWQQQYREQAEKMRVSSVHIPFAGRSIPKGISQDALMQFIMQYAQLTTYGSIRNTYEAVDVSHFQSGRTECVRPVSVESVAFVRSLSQQKPDAETLAAALAEHKARIKAAKLGQGANRHLLGLQLMAKRSGSRRSAFFQDPGYLAFTTDFLSTSTLGDDAVVHNFAFAPTSPGGLGINYTLTAEGWLFTLSYLENQRQDAGVFLEALKQGADELLTFVNSIGALSQVPSS